MLLNIIKVLPLAAMIISVPTLSGCSALLPLNYKDYSGKDAATLVVQHRKGEIGTLYVSFYEKKGACYDRTERYELDSSVFGAEGSVISRKIPPGKLVAFQQIHGGGKFAKIDGDMKYNHDGYTEIQWIPLIPQPGKRYYVALNYGAREIPANYSITVNTDPSKVFNEFKDELKPNWDANLRCPHLIGGS
ncbi:MULTISPECIES: hypothetical protein [unclassified Pantoea]|jgi:hypothetical protein|uniref:hypothetical protein n=1 Tax=unclassified Pantoea TaxID=2630326 RepID=UPI0013287AB9|nr:MULTISPECIES: hypothetical protein [unclassified Pantoea]MXP55348.1 hypothetical protein [Pantoea sp. Seng]